MLCYRSWKLKGEARLLRVSRSLIGRLVAQQLNLIDCPENNSIWLARTAGRIATINAHTSWCCEWCKRGAYAHTAAVLRLARTLLVERFTQGSITAQL